MATQNPGASNGLIALVGIIFGSIVTAIVTYAPLDPGRPAENIVPVPAREEGLQHIDARLWEDPFAALARHLDRENHGNGAKAEPGSGVDDICGSISRIDRRESQLLLVPVMVSNAPYADAGEQRMRTRYAVQAALAVAHFTPTDYEHIGFFSQRTNGAKMPFELFKRKSGREKSDVPAASGRSQADSGRSGSGPGSLYALVLWVGEEDLLQETDGRIKPLSNIYTLAAEFSRKCKPAMETAVLGPARSDTLRAMLAELDCGPGKSKCEGRWASGKRDERARPRLNIYSAFATASGIDLLTLNDSPRIPCGKSDWLNADWESQLALDPRRSGSLISDYFRSCGINFFSTIATDQELGVVLARELRRRDPENEGLASGKYHVALVSEWDTYYGRMLPKSVMRAGGEQLERDCEDDPSEIQASVKAARKKPHPCTVLRFTYMRGLDGSLGTDPKHGGSPGADSKVDFERAEGAQQLDYLRRLSQRIKITDEYLRRTEKRWILSSIGRYADHQIRAIGVLGVDVYDKISILRALRKDFPNAVFFTTDLDARLLNRRDLAWTRNLVVASSLGFTLSDCVQKGIPPFRGVYQTSAYLSARLALYNAFSSERSGRGVLCPEDPSGQALFNEARESTRSGNGANGYVVGQNTIDVWLARPRVFEVGLSQVWDLSRDASEAAISGGIGDVHPPVPEFMPDRRLIVLGGTLAVLVCIALYFIPPVQRTVQCAGDFLGPVFVRDSGAWTRRLFVMFLVLVVLVIEALMLCAFLEAGAHRGEPFAWLEGISIWPSELVRNVALVLTYVFLFSACGRLEKSNAEMRSWVSPTATSKLSWWQWLTGSLSVAGGRGTCDGEFFDSYARLSSPRACFCRALAGAGAFWTISILLMEQFGYPPLPVRGEYAAQLDYFLILILVPSFLVLLFFVVDATRMCERFSFWLSTRSDPCPWDPDTLKLPTQFSPDNSDLAAKVTDAWAMTRAVALRTAAIGPMVYFPFVVLGLLVLARWERFDNWGASLGLIVTLAASFLIACIAAGLLQRTATRVRNRAIGKLEECLLKRRGRDDKTEPTEKQIDQIIGSIRTLREGAFVPILEQPVVVASLFPFATVLLPKIEELLRVVR